MRRAVRLVVVVLAAAVLYLGVTLAQVWFTANRDQRVVADAIIVLGAAQYDGQPSPALRARLDHATALYAQDKAAVVWVTGGRQPGDRFSEASTSSRYLIRNGVPSDDVKLEIHGANSYESLAAVARYLRDEGQTRVLLVSDPWHSHRISAIAQEVGLDPRVSPAGRPELSGYGARRLSYETVAVALGRIVGYRRLTGFDFRSAQQP